MGAGNGGFTPEETGWCPLVYTLYNAFPSTIFVQAAQALLQPRFGSLTASEAKALEAKIGALDAKLFDVTLKMAELKACVDILVQLQIVARGGLHLRQARRRDNQLVHQWCRCRWAPSRAVHVLS